MDREKLLVLIRDKAYEKRDVTLSSGKKSNFYIDCRQVTLHHEGAYLVGSLIYEMLISGPDGISAVGGLTLGADPIVSSVAVISHMKGNPMSAFIIRKEVKAHGTVAPIEGTKNLEAGMPVAILEDVVTTGGSTLKAIDAAEKNGLVVKRVIAIVDRSEGGKEAVKGAGYHLESLFVKEEIENNLPG
jgi:orotate phosphoribosyltransferase